MNGSGSPLRPERWARISSLFHEASALEGEALGAFLAERCADDAELRHRVERLLAADEAPEMVIDRSVEDLALPLLTGDPPAAEFGLEAGTTVGRYRVIEPIGSGGMGTVYRAERGDGAYERRVALKVVRTERLGDDGERRFLRERQILARLHHPGIATLLDGGVTGEGRPYLVMELVEGATLTEHADRAGLDTAARLRLMRRVVEVIDFAHRNLVVHRDLKPSNILVSDDGAVKLLDFGIAHLLEDDAGEGTTRTGVLLLTPEYAAPEQIRGEAVTTATDVYALGAILYELLSGRRAFPSGGHRWKDLERILTEDPPPLSRAEGLDRAARRVLEGDLTTIVSRAMQKDPSRRYPSARAFGDDLERWLAGRPVAARPDSLGYRVTKFVGRNRVATGLTALAALAVAAGVAGTAWQARQTRIEAERTRAVSDFVLGLFEGADPDLDPGSPITAAELLEAGLAGIDSLDAGPETRVDLLTVLGVIFGKIGHAERSEELLRKAVDEASRSLGDGDAATGTALDALGVRLALAGDLSEAEEVLRRALEARRASGAPAIDVGATQGNLAKAIENQGRLDDAVDAYRTAIATLDRATRGDSAVFATELMGLAQTYETAERFEEADALMRAVLRFRARDGDTPAHAVALHNLGHLVSLWRDDPEEAIRLHREALAMWRRIFPDGHPEISRSLEQIARLEELRGRWAAADSLYDEALGQWSDVYGSDHPHLAALNANRANLRYRNGEFGAAAEVYREVVRIYRRVGDLRLLAVSIHNLGVIQREAGDYMAADSLIREALELRHGSLAEPHSDIAQSLGALAGLSNLRGRYADAESLARAAVAQYEAVLGPDHSLLLWPRLELGIALVGQGRDQEAGPLLETVHGRFAETLNPADAGLGRASLWLGIAEARLGRPERARTLLEAALPSLRASLRPDAPERLRAERELAALPG